MDIDKLEDRELDVAVAEARGWIKGIRYWTDPSKPDALWGGTGYTTEEWYDYDLPHYRPSADIAAAWELVEELSIEQPSMAWSIQLFYLRDDIRMWEAKFWGLDDLDRDLSWSSEDRQLPTAVAHTYLKAKGIQ